MATISFVRYLSKRRLVNLSGVIGRHQIRYAGSFNGEDDDNMKKNDVNATSNKESFTFKELLLKTKFSNKESLVKTESSNKESLTFKELVNTESSNKESETFEELMKTESSNKESLTFEELVNTESSNKESETFEELVNTESSDKESETFEELMKTESSNKESLTFEELMNNSRLLTSCGHSPVGRVVMGKIIATVNDDLYIDFGGKFHGVVPHPKKEARAINYQKGSLVEVKVKDLELTLHFLGHSRDSSLLEADIELVGPLRKGRINVLKNLKSSHGFEI